MRQAEQAYTTPEGNATTPGAQGHGDRKRGHALAASCRWTRSRSRTRAAEPDEGIKRSPEPATLSSRDSLDACTHAKVHDRGCRGLRRGGDGDLRECAGVPNDWGNLSAVPAAQAASATERRGS